MAGAGEVLGQLATDHASADDGHPLRRLGQLRLQAAPAGQVVDPPAQRRRQRGWQCRTRALSQHQLGVRQGAAGGAQLVERRCQTDHEGLRVQAHPQAAGGVSRRLADQCLGRLAAAQRHRQFRLMVEVALAGTDQGDRHLGIQLAQGFDGGPASEAGTDHHDSPALRRALHRTGGRCLAPDEGLEVQLGHAAQRAFPVVRDVLEASAGGQAAVRIAHLLVVDQAAGAADELPPGLGDGAHAGISSFIRRAISQRRCLMAGVTMATNCASLMRRCGAALFR
ncbi:hypothetical protein D3C84_669810 [compost metagenome]